ncbi:Transcription factor [Penicillium bovifimosum]|uniref:Transcription factor n=1 Tax=Penicillium bovifimosum TaxID=126998 RepID=A0A9W9HBU8_9EURO|nr:Transcription factor [Penicillium bovifimosum]KAJ5143825.1 Transcription factor [Penicillium bovifimosum]
MKMSNHDHTKQFQALAPGPPRIFTPQTSTAVSRPKKSSTACLACKAAKRKCSGPDAPCKACRANNTECHFDPTRDLRRKVAVKRAIHELANYKDLLESLVKTIRSDDQGKCERVMGLIRGNASYTELAHAVGCPSMTFGDPQELSNASKLAIAEYGDTPVEVADPKRRPSDPSTIPSSPEESQPIKASQWPSVSPYARVTLESLCDIPLFEVPAKPWTKVTDNDYLVSHLVSLYFTWDHPCSQFLDQGIFLKHMRLGKQNSEFCTPLLVNSLLSMASAHSDSPDVLSAPEDAFSRGQNFFSEAQRLWEAEDLENDGRELPQLQALLLMCCVFKCLGRLRKSWMMLSQANQLARDIGLTDTPAESETKMSPEMRRVRAVTSWGLFNLSSQMSIELPRAAPVAYPTCEVERCGNEDVNWTPYPRSNKITCDTKPARLPQVREGLAQVAQILVDVKTLVSDKHHRRASSTELWGKANGPFERLTDWLQQWPGVAEIQNDPVPQVLLLRIKCLQAIVRLFEILKDHPQAEYSQKAQYYQVTSLVETARCLRIHRQKYGLKHIPTEMVDATHTGLCILAYQLDHGDEAKQAFIELCQFGMALSQRFKPTADVIRAIRKRALNQSLRLPSEAIEIFDGPEQWNGIEP